MGWSRSWIWRVIRLFSRGGKKSFTNNSTTKKIKITPASAKVKTYTTYFLVHHQAIPAKTPRLRTKISIIWRHPVTTKRSRHLSIYNLGKKQVWWSRHWVQTTSEWRLIMLQNLIMGFQLSFSLIFRALKLSLKWPKRFSKNVHRVIYQIILVQYMKGILQLLNGKSRIWKKLKNRFVKNWLIETQMNIVQVLIQTFQNLKKVWNKFSDLPEKTSL